MACNFYTTWIFKYISIAFWVKWESILKFAKLRDIFFIFEHFSMKQMCLSTKDSSASSSELDVSQETIDEMAEVIEKHYGKKEANDLREIAGRINAAKNTGEKNVADYVRVFQAFSHPAHFFLHKITSIFWYFVSLACIYCHCHESAWKGIGKE